SSAVVDVIATKHTTLFKNSRELYQGAWHDAYIRTPQANLLVVCQFFWLCDLFSFLRPNFAYDKRFWIHELLAGFSLSKIPNGFSSVICIQ
ncbi:hypothetical protein MLD52_22900, partial [Puniceicoccaceae bacterium K14]|nr:hypothetical protein [Puniceicoccaceae bacterium K14]